jgi:hypothetical protein
MGNKIVNIKVILTSLLITGSAMAAEFQPMGYEALSMGGAGVASSRGSYAPYYNPALLSKQRHSVEVSLSAGVGYREVNLADHIDKLSEIDINNTLDNVASLDSSSLNVVGDSVTIADSSELSKNITTIKKELRLLSTKNGLELMPNGALAVQIGQWGVGLYAMGEASGRAYVDTSHLDIIVKQDIGGTTKYVQFDETDNTLTLSDETSYESSSLEYAVNNKQTYLALSGLVYEELPVSYAMTIPAVPGTLAVGGSLKIMHADTYSSIVNIDTESGDIQDDLKDSKKSGSNVGLDLGVLYNPPNLNNVSLGLVAKNINKPKFDTSTGSKIAIDPQVRAGAAIDLSGDTLTLALDLDLTNNKTYIPDYDSQFIGGGLSYHPVNWFSIRGGLMQNLKESDEGLVYTAGIGLGLKWLQFDLAGEMSSKKGEYDGTSAPRYARVQLSFVSKWN